MRSFPEETPASPPADSAVTDQLQEGSLRGGALWAGSVLREAALTLVAGLLTAVVLIAFCLPSLSATAAAVVLIYAAITAAGAFRLGRYCLVVPMALIVGLEMLDRLANSLGNLPNLLVADQGRQPGGVRLRAGGPAGRCGSSDPTLRDKEGTGQLY
jgi:hypothetical protein